MIYQTCRAGLTHIRRMLSQIHTHTRARANAYTQRLSLSQTHIRLHTHGRTHTHKRAHSVTRISGSISLVCHLKCLYCYFSNCIDFFYSNFCFSICIFLYRSDLDLGSLITTLQPLTHRTCSVSRCPLHVWNMKSNPLFTPQD